MIGCTYKSGKVQTIFSAYSHYQIITLDTMHNKHHNTSI